MPVRISRRNLVAGAGMLAAPRSRFAICPDYLAEPDSIPAFWVASFDEVSRFLKERVRKGRVQVLGKSAGGRPVRAVFYGEPRKGKGTTTFSGSLGYGDVRAYIGPDHARKVYLGMAGVHGGEFEGMVGAVNLIAVLESGKDLRGREWPEIAGAVQAPDRASKPGANMKIVV